MKKQVLLHLLLLICSINSSLNAQTRLSLYEEFSGEHCIECAVVNPSLRSLISTNSSKVVHIVYPTPYPVGGPVYNTYPLVPSARISYYGINKAPQGRLNGTKPGSGTSSSVTGHVSNLRQEDIDTPSSATAPFDMTISHAWSTTGDSVIATITVTTPAAYSPAGANFKLRLALIENLHYQAPPGINGEQDFPNTVRDMYPSAAGTSIPAAWSMGQTATYTITNKVARYIDKEHANLVAWIQNDADKSIQQVAVSTPVAISLDVAATGVRPSARLQCSATSVNATSYALLHNAGTSTLTSARIYYHNDLSYVPQIANWTGSLITGATTIVPLNAVNIPGGNHYIMDSVVLPNGALDINPGNTVSTGSVSVYNTIPASLPIVTGFEGPNGTLPTGWLLYDADSNGRNFSVAKNIFGGSAGYGGSTWFLLHNNYYVPTGETNYAILPNVKLIPGCVLSFAYAHAQFNTENDMLEVVYSQDCGDTWNTVWSAAGSTLSTAPATVDYFIPTSTQWSTQSVDLTNVPSSAMLALRATSDYGNTLYIDNIRLEAAAGIGAAAISDAMLYPNPAQHQATLQFNNRSSQKLDIVLTDAAGRTLQMLASGQFNTGAQQLTFSTEHRPAGFYMIRIMSDREQIVKPLSIVQ